MTDWKTILIEHKAQLIAHEQATINDRKPVALDQQSVGRLSRMDALQQQAMAKAQDSNRITQINRINAALKRIDEDEFGYCIDCGEDIGTPRLKIDPAIATCVRCAQQSEN